jgi:hypothetical protein
MYDLLPGGIKMIGFIIKFLIWGFIFLAMLIKVTVDRKALFPPDKDKDLPIKIDREEWEKLVSVGVLIGLSGFGAVQAIINLIRLVRS